MLLFVVCTKIEKKTLFLLLLSIGTASVNLARSNQSNNEYNISKKLVIVSTVHILLNVPR